jgi:glycosyltransferase involved in cell wall biosynthesis
MPRCAVVSFRLGGSDGVSIVAATWAAVLRGLGFEVVTVAGDGPVDRRVAGLELGAVDAPDPVALERALADADLVVVENLCTIPMNLPAARAVAAALRGRPAILHHHDPPWQRPQWEHVTELPPDDPAWRHVAINQLSQRQLAERGFDAVTIYNGFDPHPPSGDRTATRATIGLDEAARLVVHPVRAIPRKNVAAAVRLAADLDAVYWLLGPAEDGYDDGLERVLATARCLVIHAPPPSMEDAYAAADLVAFPSTWEGFGNPPIEAALHRRPVVVGPYPVADELRAFGFKWFALDDLDRIDAFLRAPDESTLDHNQRIAREHFSIDRVARDVERLLQQAGWLP